MFEMFINPKKAEKHPWEMFFIGLIYASLSVFLVYWIFSGDAVLSKYSGILVVTFSVMFTLPFMYYLFKFEEEKDLRVTGVFRILEEHERAVLAFMWLFLGFIVAFSALHIVLDSNLLFKAQIQTYCVINSPINLDDCVSQYEISKKISSQGTGFATKEIRLLSIIENNVYVLIFTLIFSLIFGAGAVFILAWNATVIAAAIGIFTKYQIQDLPVGIFRYMIHGFPEIAAYFISALAGGIIGVGVIQHGIRNRKFLRVVGNAIILLFSSIIVLILAGLIEVYITPLFFN